ncbi:protein Dok-7 [Eurytemora carolleeae]|uniref:protein Dok-7 n=1 Tax=Eurytemora carolleeae TaxID=1294199 RepID=UPI000C78B20D|nr:protein Dok-7 [Eurytemora carolleeae]|eukprot:XP_023324986.1 protein Dok-7-like [Eurytemora affinis]
MALIFQDNVIIIALQSREILIKWQVRLTGQFEEGQQYTVHLVSAPKKGKLGTGGQMKLHLQNNRFSLTTGIPPHLIHTWNMIDLRRYGGVDGGRFCIEGGTRCGKGEGLHVFRVDNSDEMQVAFDLAGKGKLENRRQRLNPQTSLSLSQSPSVSSNLSTVHRSGDSGESGSSGSPLLHFGSVRSKEEIQRNRSRSRSRSMNTSGAWSSLDNGQHLVYF